MVSFSDRAHLDRHAVRGWTKAEYFTYLAPVVLGGWLVIAILSLVMFRNLTVDDAFISWRHGLNLVEHGRYQANPVGQAVEAATSPIYGLLAAVPAWFSMDPVLFFKLVSIAIVLIAASFSLKLVPDRVESALLILLMFGGPLQAVHLWAGLETPLFASTLTFLLLGILGVVDLSNRSVGFLMAILVAVRPEGMVVAAGMIGTLGAVEIRRSRIRIRTLIRQSAAVWLPPLLVVVFLLVTRKVLFDVWLPNSATTKLAGAGSIGGRVAALYSTIHESFWLLAALLVIVMVFRGRALAYHFALVGVATVLPTFLAYAVTAPAMNYAQRFSFQIVWPLIVAGVMMIAKAKGRRPALIAGVAVSSILTLSISGGEYRDLLQYHPRAVSAHGALGEVLAARDPGILVMGDAGMTPLVSGWDLRDTLFLVTPREVGLIGIAEELIAEPRYVLALHAESPGKSEPRFGAELISDMASDQGAQYIGSILWRDDYWLQIWIGPGLVADAKFVEDIKKAAADSVRLNSESRLRDALLQNYWWR